MKRSAVPVFMLTIGIPLPLAGQVLSETLKDDILKYTVSIEVDENYLHGAWDPVIREVSDKRMVILGEFNHGSREVFVVRNDLIEWLHQKLGFDLLLFESGIGEVGAVEQKKDDLEKSALTSGFFGGWRTREFEDLLQYVSENGISIGGFDVQRTGSTFTEYLSGRLEDPALFRNLEQEFITVKSRLSNYRSVYDSVRSETERIMDTYLTLWKSLDPEESLGRKTIENRISYLEYMLEFTRTKDWNRRWRTRDSIMAENVKWILKQNEPGKKAIIIAHNFHISRFNEKEEVMGEFLGPVYGEDMYVIGAFAKAGTYLNNSGQPEQMSPPDSTSLDVKHIIEAVNTRVSFLPIHSNISEGGEWLAQPIKVKDTFIDLSGSDELIPAKCYDGLILIDTVSPPEH